MNTELREYLDELTDPRRPVKLAKLTNLSDLTDEERGEFARRWRDVPLERRREVVQELGELAEDNVELNFDAVFLEALRDPDANVRVGAVQGLWEYEGRELIGPLVELLREDSDVGVRAEVALALGRFALAAEFDAIRPREAELVDEALRSVAEDERESTEVRARAVESAGVRSEAWAQDLVGRAYRSGNRRLKVSALHAMGRSCDEGWLPVLIDELRSDDPEIRFEAATACGEIADEAAVPPLAALIEDEDEEVRAAAIDALGKIGGPGAREELRRHLDDPNVQVREAVAAALTEAEFLEDPLAFRFQL